MGNQALIACRGCGTEFQMDAGASAPHERDLADEQSLRSMWVATIDDGRADPKRVDFLVDSVFDVSDQEDFVEIVFPDGARAIHHAVMSDNLPLVAYLANFLSCNIDSPHTTTCDTPLLLAVQNGNLEIVKFLVGLPTSAGTLERKVSANIHLCNMGGETVIDLAEMDENVELLKILCNGKRRLDEAIITATYNTTIHATSSIELTDTSNLGEMPIAPDEEEDGPPPSGNITSTSEIEFAVQTRLVSDKETDNESDSTHATTPPHSSMTDNNRLEQPTTNTLALPPSLSTLSAFSNVGGMDEDEPDEQMCGWLQKRRYKENRRLHLKQSWSDRYVVLRDGWLCWGSHEVSGSALESSEKRRENFNQSWHASMIDSASATASKSGRNFKIEIKESLVREQRAYEFKARSEAERDEWIASINTWIKVAALSG